MSDEDVICKKFPPPDNGIDILNEYPMVINNLTGIL